MVMGDGIGGQRRSGDGVGQLVEEVKGMGAASHHPHYIHCAVCRVPSGYSAGFDFEAGVSRIIFLKFFKKKLDISVSPQRRIRRSLHPSCEENKFI